MEISFISSKDNDEEHVLHLKSDNVKFMIYDTADEVIGKPFNHLLIDSKWTGNINDRW